MDHFIDIISKLHPAAQVVSVFGAVIIIIFVVAVAALVLIAIIKSL